MDRGRRDSCSWGQKQAGQVLCSVRWSTTRESETSWANTHGSG